MRKHNETRQGITCVIEKTQNLVLALVLEHGTRIDSAPKPFAWYSRCNRPPRPAHLFVVSGADGLLGALTRARPLRTLGITTKRETRIPAHVGISRRTHG